MLKTTQVIPLYRAAFKLGRHAARTSARLASNIGRTVLGQIFLSADVLDRLVTVDQRLTEKDYAVGAMLSHIEDLEHSISEQHAAIDNLKGDLASSVEAYEALYRVVEGIRLGAIPIVTKASSPEQELDHDLAVLSAAASLGHHESKA